MGSGVGLFKAPRHAVKTWTTETDGCDCSDDCECSVDESGEESSDERVTVAKIPVQIATPAMRGLVSSGEEAAKAIAVMKRGVRATLR